MNQQEIINLIKTTPFDHIKIAQLNNGIIDIQILPLNQTQSNNPVNEILTRRNQRKAMTTEKLQTIREQGNVQECSPDFDFWESLQQFREETDLSLFEKDIFENLRDRGTGRDEVMF
jgi:hypothetical protein